jgi:hypothetical protein
MAPQQPFVPLALFFAHPGLRSFCLSDSGQARMQQSGRTNYGKIALIVTAYFIVSITLVFSNKFLMSKEHSIPAPLFVTWFQVRLDPSFRLHSLVSRGADLAAAGRCVIYLLLQCVLTAIIIYILGTLGQSSPAGSWMKEFPAQGELHILPARLAPLA